MCIYFPIIPGLFAGSSGGWKPRLNPAQYGSSSLNTASWASSNRLATTSLPAKYLWAALMDFSWSWGVMSTCVPEKRYNITCISIPLCYGISEWHKHYIDTSHQGMFTSKYSITVRQNFIWEIQMKEDIQWTKWIHTCSVGLVTESKKHSIMDCTFFLRSSSSEWAWLASYIYNRIFNLNPEFTLSYICLQYVEYKTLQQGQENLFMSNGKIKFKKPSKTNIYRIPLFKLPALTLNFWTSM